MVKIKFDKILGLLREEDNSGVTELQSIDGGFANSVYLSSQLYDGGAA